MSIFTTDELAPLNEAYTPVLAALEATEDKAGFLQVFTMGAVIGAQQQRLLDQRELEHRAREIARVQHETVPVFVADPKNLIPGFDDVEKRAA